MEDRKETIREMNAVRFDCDDEAPTERRISVAAIAEDMMEQEEPTCQFRRIPCRYSEITEAFT